MEIVYLYIENDGRNIKNCEFNFSPKYRFHFDKNKRKLSLTKGEPLPSGWFGTNIDNVTAIIGKNGAGKSNLIESIVNVLCGNGGGLVIWSYKGKLYRNKQYLPLESDFPIKELAFWWSPFNNIDNCERITDAAVIYYSPNNDRIIQNKSLLHGFIDMSTACLLREKKHYVNEKNNSYYFYDIDYLQITDTCRQILFFKNFKHDFFPEDIRVPEYLKMTLRSYDVINQKHPTFVRLMKDVDNSFIGQLQSILLKQFFSKNTIPETLDSETTFEDVLRCFFLNTTERPNIYDELIDLYSKDNISCKLNKRKGLSKWDEFTFSIKKNALNERFMTALFGYYHAQEPCYSSFSTLEHHKNIANNEISIRWDGLSSGELAFYNFLARINSGIISQYKGEVHDQAKVETTIYNNNKIKSLILLLDEPELSFHPEWQQKFINLFFLSLEKLHPEFRFQVIIASHSPILVSDFPQRNIIFLDKDCCNGNCKPIDSITRENTFGANIHTLYKNSFFLAGIPIGEFAKNKINRLFVELEKGIIRNDTLQEIQLIGEPIIKSQLLKLYQQYDNLPPYIDKRISRLEEEVKMLKSQLNDKD